MLPLRSIYLISSAFHVKQRLYPTHTWAQVSPLSYLFIHNMYYLYCQYHVGICIVICCLLTFSSKTVSVLFRRKSCQYIYQFITLYFHRYRYIMISTILHTQLKIYIRYFISSAVNLRVYRRQITSVAT